MQAAVRAASALLPVSPCRAMQSIDAVDGFPRRARPLLWPRAPPGLGGAVVRPGAGQVLGDAGSGMLWRAGAGVCGRHLETDSWWSVLARPPAFPSVRDGGLVGSGALGLGRVFLAPGESCLSRLLPGCLGGGPAGVRGTSSVVSIPNPRDCGGSESVGAAFIHRPGTEKGLKVQLPQDPAGTLWGFPGTPAPRLSLTVQRVLVRWEWEGARKEMSAELALGRLLSRQRRVEEADDKQGF